MEVRHHRRLRRTYRLERLLDLLRAEVPPRWVGNALRDAYAVYALLRRVSRPRAGRSGSTTPFWCWLTGVECPLVF